MADNEENVNSPVQEKLSPIASMDELTLNEDFPKPDEEAISAITKTHESSLKTAVSNTPEIFDPSIHATGKDGQPSITSTGKFRRKKGTQNFKRPDSTQPETPPPERKSLQAAVATSGIIEQLSVSLISDDFIYSELERTSNVEAWEKTYDYYGGVSLYPPLELAANHIAIIVSRAHKEKTRPKLAAIGAWIKAKFKRRPKNGTYVSGRNDGRGENNMGAKESMGAAKA